MINFEENTKKCNEEKDKNFEENQELLKEKDKIFEENQKLLLEKSQFIEEIQRKYGDVIKENPEIKMKIEVSLREKEISMKNQKL